MEYGSCPDTCPDTCLIPGAVPGLLRLVHLVLRTVPGMLVLVHMLGHEPGDLLARVVVPGVSRHAEARRLFCFRK